MIQFQIFDCVDEGVNTQRMAVLLDDGRIFWQVYDWSGTKWEEVDTPARTREP